MISRMLKSGLRKSLNAAGLEIHRKKFQYRPQEDPRCSLSGILQHAKRMGLSPATVIDVGAAFGSFALECFKVFPKAKYVLIEPLEEYKEILEKLISADMLAAEYVLAAATAQPGEVTINVHPDLVGSSLYLENEDSNVNGMPRVVPGLTLDSLSGGAEWRPPFLLKIDAQGAELEILSGFEKNLRHVEYILLEVSMFKFFDRGPQFHDVVSFMKARGFVAYDICGLQYRLLDDALSQIDLAFVKETSQFRKYSFYATRKQREEQFNKSCLPKDREPGKNERTPASSKPA